MFNHTKQREEWVITPDGGDRIENKTLVDLAEDAWTAGDYEMRNETDRTLEMVINGKDTSRFGLNIVGNECVGGVCVNEVIVEGEIETTPRMWSNPDSWGGTLPVEGDDVEIESTWNMVLDIADPPRLNSLAVNGRLTFLNQEGLDIKLSAGNIFVRAGEFIIGTEEEPFLQKAEIELLGETESQAVVLGSTVDGGNKGLFVSGLVSFYGGARDRMSRLQAVADAGSSTITVEDGLDWAAGDEIYIAPTTIQYHYSEYRTIVSNEGGVLTLDEPLEFYHWGAAASNADTLNGIDTRGEVLLLSRNIKVYGEDRDNWGGQIMATDIFELDGTFREGSIYMDYVQVYNCSQKNTYRAAIRFEEAAGGPSRISNSAIHNGEDWGLSVLGSSNIEILNNVFVGYNAVGMRLDRTRNVKVNGNFIGDVRGRGLAFIDMTIDKEACVAYGSYEKNDVGTATLEMEFQDNIAAGCVFAGYIAPGHACGETEQVSFKNNIAHSIGGYGAYGYGNPAIDNTQCFEFSDFAAYKTLDACVVTFEKTLDHKAHHITCIDTVIGMSLNTAEQEADEVWIELEDSFFHGETEADDCPSQDACICEPKYAMMTGANMNDGKDLMPTGASALPIYSSHGEGNWGGRMTIKNSRFVNFLGRSSCGERSVLFERNPHGSDKIPPHFFENCSFENVDDQGMGYLEKPNPAWANIKDCGNFPCTAPNNVFFVFTDTTYSGTTPSVTVADFTMVPDDETVGGTYENCSHIVDAQAYICQTNNIGLLMFENLDDDAWDRAVQPVHLIHEPSGFDNKVNAMMDHIWDTFYTGQRRMARFPTALLTD